MVYGSCHRGSLISGLTSQESWGFILVLSPTDYVTWSKLGLRFHIRKMAITMEPRDRGEDQASVLMDGHHECDSLASALRGAHRMYIGI